MAKPTIHCFLVLSLFIYVCRSQFAEKYTGINPCTVKEKCSACIQTPTCAWCSEPGFLNYPRCFQPSAEAPLGHCDESYIYQAEVSYSEMMSKTLTKGGASRSANMSASGGYSGSYSGMSSSQFSSSESHSFSHSESSAREVIQISPQKVTLKLKINESYRFDVSFAQAEDYPVDLYYLMDLSRSMADDKDNLSKLGDLLSASMKKLTSNFRLGFGSFVDKVVMPYVSTVPKKLLKPCDTCEAPYGYRNHMSLSTQTNNFTEEVRKAAVSGNLDAPEGGFDAIMQAIVCGEIGWRPKARRLLVFSTDAGFHYAGDGKLGGIVKPNDGECHMKNREYAYSSVQDYPSISQINVKVKENAINMIFAVTEEQISVYDQLKDLIEGSTAGKLTNDSSNVVKLIQEQYGKITSSVQMSDNSTGPISIKYYSSCLGEGPLKQTSKCDGLKVGQMVKFTAEFLVTSCPKDRKKWTQTIKIYPVGINESLIVDLEMLCDCPCERAGHSAYKEKSPSCSGHGTYTCGVCDCDPQHFGVSCECSGNQYNINNNTSSCISDINTLLECSGHGTCTCGQCKCDEGPNGEPITGKYCECNNFQCDHHNGLLCSGPDHGECVCGGCVCKDGWSGVACDCKTSNNTCIPPGGGDICSNHGHCVCGQCVCDGVPNEKGYFGRYCDKCPNCSDRQCSQYNECVQCKQFKSGPKMKDDRCDKECAFEPIPVDKVEANVDKDENLCTYTDEDFCRFFYVYSYDENNKLIIHVQTKKECPPQVFMLGIVLGVIAAIVLIGLAVLLLWKMVTTIHDRREFARFEKERMMAKWDTGENPIYKQATSTFKNPTYAGR